MSHQMNKPHLALKRFFRGISDNPRGSIMIVMYRWAHFASIHKNGLMRLNSIWAYPTLVFYRLITELFFGYEIPAATTIGSGFYIHHGYGIVINKHASIGKCVHIRHQVTIGCKTLPDGSQGPSPKIEDFVEIGAGALIIGDVVIGKGAKIGAGAVVTRSVQAGSVVGGNPAMILNK